MKSAHAPLTLGELKSLRKPIRNVNIEQREKLTPLDRLALLITERVGTMGFFLIILIWTIGWLAWNTVGPSALQFDPFPAFVLWLFISNVIQLMLLPLLMVGQNLQARHAEARAQADFEVNVRAEREIETILQHLENQEGLILTIVKRLNQK